MNIFDPLITGSLSVSGSGEISGDLTVLGTINATISGTTSNAITASEAPKYTLTSSFENFTGSYTTGSFTGSFIGDGGDLYNIPASGVTGLNLTQISDGNVTASVSNTNGLRVNSKTEITGSLIVTEGITGSIDYSNITNKPTLVSGSSQIDITGTTGYSTFSSSFSSSISEVSSSITITTNNLDGRLDNIETSTGSLNSFTSSINTTIKNKLNTDGVISGSVQVNLPDVTGFSEFSSSVSSSISTIFVDNFEQDNRLDVIETSTSSLNSFTTSINTTIKNKLNTDGVISGSVQVNLPDVTGYSTFSSSVSSSIGSLSSSVATTTNNLFQTMSSLSSSFTDTDNNHTQRLNTIESRYATTGSNIFNGTQTITGSLYVSQNLIVQGESSLENITASAVSIGTNKIILNNDSPAIRYAGISVFDSGSTNVTASLLYDSLTNNWKFEHSDVGTNDASIMLFGPLGVGLDNAPTLDGNFITKVENNGHGHHITTSSIFDNGSKVSINSNTEITGSLTVTGVIRSTTTPLVSGSSQIDHNTTTNYVSNQHIDHTTVSISAGNGLSGGGTIASTRTISLDTASSTFTTGVKSKMNTDGVISGSSQVLSGTGIWSGSAQLPSGVVSGSVQVISSLPVGTVSGSSQVLSGTGIWSGSAQLPSGVISGSAQVVSSLPAGTISGSAQLTSTFVQKSGDTMTGQLIVGSTGTAGAATLKVNTSSAISFIHSQENFSPNMTAGQTNILVVGQAGNTKNAGYLGYNWSSSASNDNFISLGHWGSDNLLRVYGNGNVFMGTVTTGVWNGTAIGDAYISSATNWNIAYNKRPSSLGFTSSTVTLTLGDATTITASVPTFNQNTTGSSASAPILTASGGLTTQQGSGTVGYVYALSSSTTGLFTAVDNSNSILTVNRHPDNYYSQLGFSSNGNLYYRSFSATEINTSQGWQTIWTSTNLTNLNQLTNGPGYLTGNQTITISGDGSGSGATSISLTVSKIQGIAFRNTASNDGVNANTLNANGTTYVTNIDGSSTNITGNATDGALYSQAYSSEWQHQIYGDYRTGIMYARGKNSGTWQSWKRVALSIATTFSSVTSVTFNHTLGTANLTAQVFDTNGDMFFPSNIRITSTQVIVTFASSRSGRLVVTG